MVYPRTTKVLKTCTLYGVVFSSLYAKCAIFALFIAFLIQPIAPAYADEADKEAASSIANGESSVGEEEELVPETEEEAEQELFEEVNTTSEDVIQEPDNTQEEISDSVTNNDDGTTQLDMSTAEVDDSTHTSASSTGESGVSTETENTEDEFEHSSSTLPTIEQTTSTGTVPQESNQGTTTSTTTPSSGGGTETDEVSVVEDDEFVELPATTTASSTEKEYVATPLVDEEANKSAETDDLTEQASSTESEPKVATTTEQSPSVHFSSLNRYQFGNADCVSVGDGSYYCSDPDLNSEKIQEDGLFVDSDIDGDKEIFIRIDGEIEQLTHNTFDDAAPHYDSVSNTVVWHRLVSGLYQIVSYDLSKEEEQTITSNDTNDMEPTRAGNYTVWQRWVNDNWEIIIFDGASEQQLTNNSFHDIAPSIRGEYIIWHTNNGGERKVVVYEIETGLMSTINDEEGGNVQNPRFVLMYDTSFENGDIITKGYDLESGELMPLSAIPTDVPSNIPASDSTGETRALIQNKTVNTKEEIVIAEPVSGDGTATATSTEPSLEENSIAPATSTESSATTTVDMTEGTEDFELTEFDVVVTPYESATSSQEVDSTGTTTDIQ